VFLAADEEFPSRLAAAGLTRDAGVVYALDVSSSLPRRALHWRWTSIWMASGRLWRLAACADLRCQPEVAPYGRAAEAVLRRRGLWTR